MAEFKVIGLELPDGRKRVQRVERAQRIQVGEEYSVFSIQYSVFSIQYSVLSTQYSVLELVLDLDLVRSFYPRSR
jgi:hypothetical protein